MTILLNCKKCKKVIDVPGALYFTPPDGETCNKYHLCIDCHQEVRDFIMGYDDFKAALNATVVIKPGTRVRRSSYLGTVERVGHDMMGPVFDVSIDQMPGKMYHFRRTDFEVIE